MYYQLREYIDKLKKERKELEHIKSKYTYWLDETILILEKSLSQLKIEPFKYRV